MVVMMHSTLGVEAAAGQNGWHAPRGRLRQAVPHAGLLPDLRPVPGASSTATGAPISTARSCTSPISMCCGSRSSSPSRRRASPPSTAGAGVARLYLEAFIEPFGTLWFIYLLPIFFVVTKADARSIPPLAIWLLAAALEIAPIDDRLDRDRRIRLAASSISIPAICSLRTSSRLPHASQARPGAGARRRSRCGRRQRRCSSIVGCQRTAVRLARARPGRRLRGGVISARCWPRCDWLAPCAIAGRTRSSSISPSSCQWRRPARCC